MRVLRIHVIIPLLALGVSCKTDLKQPTHEKQGLVHDFQDKLSELEEGKTSSLDEATLLFQLYAGKTKDTALRDSLFQPYFDFYSSIGDAMVKKPDSIFKRYGFIQKTTLKGKRVLRPTQSMYLRDNIIQHLSPAMQEFMWQQLLEFSDSKSLDTIAARAIWWENFMKREPDFFLWEMTKYHYQNWHVKRLLLAAFDEEASVKQEVLDRYKHIIEAYPDCKTSETLKQYLKCIASNNGQKTQEVEAFLQPFL